MLSEAGEAERPEAGINPSLLGDPELVSLLLQLITITTVSQQQQHQQRQVSSQSVRDDGGRREPKITST